MINLNFTGQLLVKRDKRHSEARQMYLIGREIAPYRIPYIISDARSLPSGEEAFVILKL